MKIRFHIIISIIVALLFVKMSTAQDFHLSHFDSNPLYLNPALTGMRLDEDWFYRFNLNYREQRGNFLGRANKIIATGFDIPLNNKFSIGEFVTNNKTINSSINTLNIMLSGSYKIIHKAANGHDRHNMSVGLQVGLLQKSFNPANLVYDSQYSASAPNGFDASLPNGENYIKQNVSTFDMNMGIYYRFIDKNKKYSPFGGFSIYHLSQPNQSFTDIYSQTPMRFTLHGGCFYRFNEAYSVLPQLMYMNQAHANELNIGIMAFDKIRCTDYEPMLGFSWRMKDAMIVHLGLKYKTYFFRVSYDINTYYLKTYGNRGLELSIVYTPKRKTNTADLVAMLVLSDSSLAKKDSASLIKPILPITPVSPDTTIIQKKSSLNAPAKDIDLVVSIPGKKTITTIIHDTIIIIEKTIVHFETVVKDTTISNKSISPVVPANSMVQTQDTTSIKAEPSKPIVIISSTLNPIKAKTTSPNKTGAPVSPISYQVQLGAFKEEVPLEMANKLLAVAAKKIKDLKDSIGYTIYTVGNFSTPDDAVALRDEMIERGFKDAFIISVPTNLPVVKEEPIVPHIPTKKKSDSSTLPKSPTRVHFEASPYDLYKKNH